MTGIEVLNQLSKKRQALIKAKKLPWNEFYTDYVEPSKYNGRKVTNPGGTIFVFEGDKQEYLKDCILAFVLNAIASSHGDMIEGYKKAIKQVYTKNGYGGSDDVYLTAGGSQYRIRICAKGELSAQEQLYKSSYPNYIVVRSFQQFYEWYVNKFGEIALP